MQDIYVVLLSISGAFILILLSVIGFFIARLVSDLKSCMSEIGKNKGRIELVEQKQESDMKQIEMVTQLEIKALSKEVSGLAANVNVLVEVLTKKSNH